MKNYIILNGKKSTDVQGLMIQALPPVQKPPMRTQIDTIDGEDGDVVTYLGFAAYDRTVKIGLRGQYRESEVVQFFNSSGEAIFSNEPDMIYQYQIVQGFSLERLRRFREANVIFHVQPVKRSVLTESYTPQIGQNLAVWTESGTKTGGFGREGEITCTLSGDVFTFDGDAKGYEVDYERPYFHYAISSPFTAKKDEKYIFIVEKLSGEIEKGYVVPILWDNASPLFDQTVWLLPRMWFGKNDGLTKTYIASVHKTDTPNGADVRSVGFMCEPENTSKDSLGIYHQRATYTNLKMRLKVFKYQSQTIRNAGNYTSMPIYEIDGDGLVTLSVNGKPPVTINMSAAVNKVFIDVEKMKAYNGDALLNRYCTGDYSDLSLEPGQNELSVVGSASSVRVLNYSSWI